VQVRYLDQEGPAVEFTGEPVTNPDGESSTLAPSQEFREWLGCEIARDQEIVLEALPFSGSAQVRVLFSPPGQPATVLDSWECYVSQFQSFAEHLTLTQAKITTYYNAGGPHSLQPCFTPGFVGSTRLSIGGNHIDTDTGSFLAPAIPRVHPGPLLPGEYPSITTNPFPDELEAPPLSWRLPGKLLAHLSDSAPLEISYARFAHDTGARFSENPATPLFGINNTVLKTCVEAIEDNAGRLFALWLRTPEPVDWRRVSLSLRIRHLQGGSPCPADYAYRRPLDLAVEALPCPDGSSAFLLGRLAGIRTRLPRGEFALTMSFDASEPGLPKLRPSVAVGSSPETLELKFLNPSGPDWPLPTQAISVPAGLVGLLIEKAGIPDSVLSDLPDLTIAGRESRSFAELRTLIDQSQGQPEVAARSPGDRLRPGAAEPPGARYPRRRTKKRILATEPRAGEPPSVPPADGDTPSRPSKRYRKGRKKREE
jgi:hypothetical protein